MADGGESETNDYAAFAILAYEFPGDDPKVADRKIRGALRRKHLGPYEPSRIDMLRRLKDKLRNELRSTISSKYYHRSHSQFASPDDFDQARLANDLSAEFPEIGRADLGRMVSLAIYVDYLR